MGFASLLFVRSVFDVTRMFGSGGTVNLSYHSMLINIS